MKAYRETHPRDRRAYKTVYDAANKEKNAAYRASRREELREKKREWYLANREAVLARVKARAAGKREEILAYQAARYEAKAEEIKRKVAAYRKANPEKKSHLENRRRARRAGNGGSHTVAEWREKVAEFGSRCAYCREEKPLTRDHVVPISRGGTDDIENIVPACRSCNSRKNARSAAEAFGRTHDAGR